MRGYGHQRGHTEKYRGNTYVVNLLPKIKIELVLADHLAEAAVAAIEEAARTGEIGDGKVFVTPSSARSVSAPAKKASRRCDGPPPVSLTGERAALVPMEEAHVPDLFEAGRHAELWAYMPVLGIETLADARRIVQEALAEQDKGACLPFTIIDRQSGRGVGSTRLYDFSVPHRQAEIGWTWLTPRPSAPASTPSASTCSCATVSRRWA